jgi:hypothetical protein
MAWLGLAFESVKYPANGELCGFPTSTLVETVLKDGEE